MLQASQKNINHNIITGNHFVIAVYYVWPLLILLFSHYWRKNLNSCSTCICRNAIKSTLYIIREGVCFCIRSSARHNIIDDEFICMRLRRIVYRMRVSKLRNIFGSSQFNIFSRQGSFVFAYKILCSAQYYWWWIQLHAGYTHCIQYKMRVQLHLEILLKSGLHKSIIL